MALKVLYEDNHLIVVDKAPGLLTQQDHSGATSLLDITRDYIKNKYHKPGRVFLGLVHRLDRSVSGAVVFARTSKAASRMHREFLSRRVRKFYIALVDNKGQRPGDRWTELRQHLLRRRGISEIADRCNESKEASLKYRVLAVNEDYCLMFIELITGRKHQIRAQMASLGTPVVGDALYGSSERIEGDAICLHSCFISFSHPTLKTPVSVRSDIPPHISARIIIPDEAETYIRNPI